MGIFSGICDTCDNYRCSCPPDRYRKLTKAEINTIVIKELKKYLKAKIADTNEIKNLPLANLNTWELARSFGNLQAWEQVLELMELTQDCAKLREVVI
jgi:hypothetical protein